MASYLAVVRRVLRLSRGEKPFPEQLNQSLMSLNVIIGEIQDIDERVFGHIGTLSKKGLPETNFCDVYRIIKFRNNLSSSGSRDFVPAGQI